MQPPEPYDVYPHHGCTIWRADSSCIIACSWECPTNRHNHDPEVDKRARLWLAWGLGLMLAFGFLGFMLLTDPGSTPLPRLGLWGGVRDVLW